jgi:hypothetical protein
VSTQLVTKESHHKQRLSPDGTLVEFLALPDELGDRFASFSATVSPGVVVPLHSHPDFDPPQPVAPPTAENIQEPFRVAAR